MAFRFKDLTINVIPENLGEAEFCLGTCFNSPCGWATQCCRFWTAALSCRRPTFLACANTGNANAILQFDDPRLELGTLKQQLQAQLAQVEQLEKQQAEADRPQTLQEAEELEQKLRGALEELQQMKRDLR